ncbi:MAG TPA: serine hydrolase [Cytophagales bacterium]|jgi:D-alanyl-D-alanine carboxypeptidase|nr:serine hydrolase [Cytophagales bacterium]
MKNIVSLIISVTVVITLFAQDKHDKVISSINQHLDQALEKENIHNVYLSIYSPSKKFEWHTARGEFKDGRKVTIQHPFYTASIGKTFTATAIGILVDQGKIHFDDPIANYLSEDIMVGLHILNDVDYGDSIQVSHLLQHTSGLPDYFGEPIDGATGIFEIIITDTNRLWEPEALIAFSKDHFKPLFAPGTGYYYTDTEYVLLGLIIEEVSGLKLHGFFEQYIFNPLDMKHTYLNQRSAPLQPTPGMAEMYAGEYEIGSFSSLSADWAGGAIVSSGKDLINFQMALIVGKLVSDNIYKAMQQWVPETKGMAYGYGLRKIVFNELSSELPELEIIGHSGANGSSMYYCPEMDIYLSGTLNQLEASKEAVIMLAEVLKLCQQL